MSDRLTETLLEWIRVLASCGDVENTPGHLEAIRLVAELTEPQPCADCAALREALAWQPIETAPKDGTQLLLLGEYGRIVGGSWNRGGALHGPHWMGGIFDPTHWMRAPPTDYALAPSQPDGVKP